MVLKWSNELISEFLDLYESEPILWHPIHGQKSTREVQDAWNRIERKCSSNINMSDLKKVKKALMQVYRTFINKIKRTSRSEAIEDAMRKPLWFALEKMDSFLNGKVQFKVTINTENIIPQQVTDSSTASLPNSSGIFDDDTEENDDQNNDANSTFENFVLSQDLEIKDLELSSQNATIVSQDAELERIVEEANSILKSSCDNNASQSNLEGDSSSASIWDPHVVIKEDSDDIEQNNPVNTDCENLELFSQNEDFEPSPRKRRKFPRDIKVEVIEDVDITSPCLRNTSIHTDDYYDLYGAFLARKLRALDETSREFAMNRIDNLLFDMKSHYSPQQTIG